MTTSTNGKFDRKPLIAGNWKMNMDHVQGITLLQKLAWTLSDAKHDYSRVEVAVFPPFTDLRGVQTLVQGDELERRLRRPGPVASSTPAPTPATSPAASWPSWAAATSWSATANAAPSTASPTSCSTPSSRPPTATASRPSCASAKALRSARPAPMWSTPSPSCAPASQGSPQEQAAELVVAYEPVWAIGTGEVAGPEDAQEMCAAIRAELAALFGRRRRRPQARLLYGGSVKANNVAAILKERDVDGVLVGGASLDAAEFANIVRFESHLLTD